MNLKHLLTLFLYILLVTRYDWFFIVILFWFRLIEELRDNKTTVIVHVEWTVSRRTDAKDATGITTTIRDIKLKPYENKEFNPVRETLADILSNLTMPHTSTIILPYAFPKFLKVTGRTITIVPQLMMRKFDDPWHKNKTKINHKNGCFT